MTDAEADIDLSSSYGLTPEAHRRLRRRTLAVLGCSQILGGASISMSVTVQTLIAEDLLDSTTWSGIASAFYTLGSASAAIALSRVMTRAGRRPGLRLGYLIAMVGSAIAFLGANASSLTIFIVGSVLLGAGQAANLQTRFAASDLAMPNRKALYISMLVWVGAVGSVAGPLLVNRAKSFAVGRGYEELAGPYLASMLFFTVAGLAVTVLLRPDPLVVTGGVTGKIAPGAARPSLRSSGKVIMSRRSSQLALVTMMMSQAVMVSVMTMTPSHMQDHGHDLGLVGQVFSAHIAGMFLFAPLVGLISDRIGRASAALVGSATLVVATVLAALASGRPSLLFPALFLLGLGWNFGLISGSALLTDSIEADERVGVQGMADMMMSLCGGAGALASGVVKSMLGYHILSSGGMVLAAAVFGWLLLDRTQRQSAAGLP